MRACFAIDISLFVLVKAMVPEGGIDDFEMTRRRRGGDKRFKSFLK